MNGNVDLRLNSLQRSLQNNHKKDQFTFSSNTLRLKLTVLTFQIIVFPQATCSYFSLSFVMDCPPSMHEFFPIYKNVIQVIVLGALLYLRRKLMMQEAAGAYLEKLFRWHLCFLLWMASKWQGSYALLMVCTCGQALCEQIMLPSTCIQFLEK